jgi:hypothetical protein
MFTPVFSGVCVARSFVVCSVLYRYVFVFLPIYFWALYYLPFFRPTTFEYPFGITMRFLSIRKVKHVLMFVDLILHGD